MDNPGDLLERIQTNVSRVILGKEAQVRLASLALLCGGHILMEDVPGVGKTVLAKSLARSVEGEFKRVQFTPDLLPADVTGTSVFDPKSGKFNFQRGPIFTNVLLADEINRASPRTQSALLESMSEGQVSAEGVTHRLPDPFLVIATQNPIEFHGTYPLPEAQLDRFAVRISLGYPDGEVETDVLMAQAQGHPFERLTAVASLEEVRALRRQIQSFRVDRDVARYMIALAQATRDHGQTRLGVSTRGPLWLFRMAQGWALAHGRDYVTPDDVKAVAVPVLAHRIVLETKSRYAGTDPADLIEELLESTAVPV